MMMDFVAMMEVVECWRCSRPRLYCFNLKRMCNVQVVKARETMTFYSRDLVAFPAPTPALPDLFDASANSAVEDHVDRLMRDWESRYCTYTKHSLLVSTFNVNGQPAPAHLPGWLNTWKEAPDICVIGLQEMDLSQQAFLFDTSTREADWLQLIRRCLHHKADYKYVAHVRMVGVLLVVYIREGCGLRESAVETAIRPTGLLNRMGNKGGVAISLRLDDSIVCFVNSHLAAGSEELARRNQDYREISQLFFPQSRRRIFDHDVIVWLGDLNYRLTTSQSIDNDYIRQLCASEDYLSLLKYDQLTLMQMKKSAFHDFTEPRIRFRPTYKYDPGTNNWDSSEKVRVPSWCDRVLYCSPNAESLTALHYASVESVMLSDHKPVIAVFELRTKHIDVARKKALHEEATREADRRANEALPQISLQSNEFDFGTVKFFEASVQPLRIVNTGVSSVRFRFKPRPDGSISNAWLSITPNAHQLKATGEECTVELCVLVDKTVAWKCPVDTVLQDILVIGLENGRDHFISITARYERSCFGSSLVQLLHTPPPVDLIDLNGDDSSYASASSDRFAVPRPLWRLAECLRSRLPELRFMEEPASNKDFLALRDALDTGCPDNLLETRCSLFSIFETLLRLIDSFPEAIVPESLHGDCAAVCDDAYRCMQLLSRLPPPQHDLFQYMMRFVAEIYARNRDAEQAAVDAMVTNVLFRSSADSSSSHASHRAVAERRVRLVRFFHTCIAHDQSTMIFHSKSQLR